MSFIFKLALWCLFDVFTGTDGGYLKFAHNLVPGRVVISKFVGNGILFDGARNSADDP